MSLSKENGRMFWFYYMLLVPLPRAHCDVIYAKHGDNVTLPCFYSSDAKYLGWYKQVAGEQPQIVSSFYKHLSNIFHQQFKGNMRFSVQTGNGHYNLSIYNVQDSDSAVYYCGSTGTSMMTQFDRELFLVLKNCSCQSFLQQPDSDSVQPGGSVTLNCTVLTGTREGERRVYWFKKDPGMSHLGVLYTDTQSSHQCGRRFKNGSAANSCVFSLTKRNVSQFDAGMYYCAVASCGQVLFGAGTRLNIGGNQRRPVQVYGVGAGLVGSLVLNIIFLTALCKMSRGKYLQSEGSQQQQENTTDTQNVELSVVEYTALDFKLRPDTSSRQRHPQEETIYSRVRPSLLK